MFIRRATPDDALAIKQVHTKTWKISYRGYIPDEVLDAKNVNDEMVEHAKKHLETAECYVVIEDDKIIGFAYVTYPESQCFEIQAIYIDPDYQKCGAGSLLMNFLCEEKARLGFTKMVIWTLKNGPSLGFYAKQGLVWTGAEKSYKYDRSVIMLEKHLV